MAKNRLVVMGGDSCSKGCEFESRHRILDGHFFTNICRNNCNDVRLKRPKINERGRGWPNFLKKIENTHLWGKDHCTVGLQFN